ncbi:hypothetical protein D7X87_05180 [bacterium D16-54]|nr:hypothetical protein D7X87_05180 [bacterium D16-54]RKJ15811.1 hypothetical protein D7X65_05175 [bacterium D16-56]
MQQRFWLVQELLMARLLNKNRLCTLTISYFTLDFYACCFFSESSIAGGDLESGMPNAPAGFS